MRADMAKMPVVPTTWKDYIETFLLGSGMVTNAVIYGADKTKSEFTLVEWASSNNLTSAGGSTRTSGLSLLPHELSAIWKSFNDPTDIRAKGLQMDSETYTCIRCDCDLIVGRTAEGGCVIGRTKAVLIVALFDDPFQANCWNMIMKLISFLRDHGF